MFPGETLLSQDSELKDPHYSDFKVLKSPAGWYVGTYWKACKKKEEACASCLSDYGYLPPEHWGDITEPGSRETGYFEKEEDAKAALDEYTKTGFLPNARI
jgi:hypothetical protein